MFIVTPMLLYIGGIVVPKLEVTTDVLIDLSNHVYMGRVKNLKVLRYKTGARAGKLFAEYSLKDESTFEHHTLDKRSLVSNLLKKAAHAMNDGKDIQLFIHKRSASQEEYSHMLAVKQVNE